VRSNLVLPLRVAFLFVVPLVPLAAQQTGTVSGTVVATEAGAPLAGASVVVVGTARSVLTNEKGQYHLTVGAGAHSVRARLIGYEAAEQRVVVPAGQTVTVDFKLRATPLSLNEIVVIGARTSRTAVETPVPVDVITAQEVIETGHTEVNQILATLAPSFNASHQTIADGSDHINPASLRGLGPDQVLVLVNGKRRHSPALVHVNGTFGRGTVGVDLNAIPAAAIERIEVLRDGAAAQYGSDAIAGVINIVLKNRASGIQASSVAGVTGEGDGEEVKADLNAGFGIGERGFFNVTAEYLDRQATDRAGPYTGPIFVRPVPPTYTDSLRQVDDDSLTAHGLTRGDFSMRIGQAAATFGTLFYNTMFPLAANAEFYSFGGFSNRAGDAGAFRRFPDQETQVTPEIFRYGFLPLINTGITDRSVGAGVRGSTNGWDVDLSLTHGRNDFQFLIENTVNASMGASSPTTFNAGRLGFAQTVGNLDLVRPVAWSAVKAMSLVLGGEFRLETYRIDAGDEPSWLLGSDSTASGQPKLAGAQGFPGFQPSNEVNRPRSSIGGYAGLESQLSNRVTLDLGGRYENYSDFGSTVTGKVAARLELVPGLALRGALSNGFRAPSLHQVWFNNVSTQFVTVGPGLEAQQVLTSNNLSRVTEAFGIPRLKEETSLNASLGATWRPRDNLSITADAYHISIDDRIVITSQFATTDTIVQRILSPFPGVGRAQFFANAVDTRTRGIDVVVAYARALGPGTLNLTAAATFTNTKVERINIPDAMRSIFANGDTNVIKGLILNREDRNRLEDGLPREKGTLSARYALGRFTGLARAAYYGVLHYRGTSSAADERFGAKTLFDLDLGLDVGRGVKVNVGGSNIFNVYPDKQVKAGNISFGRFVYSRRVTQFGMNGGFYYARLLLSL
jgi:iron complex outermembrane recepter protein